MSVFATWFGTRSFLFIGRKSARRRQHYGMPGGGYYLDFTSRHNWL